MTVPCNRALYEVTSVGSIAVTTGATTGGGVVLKDSVKLLIVLLGVVIVNCTK